MKTADLLKSAAVAASILLAPLASMAQDADLILYYDFEKVAGDEAVDMSGKGRVGVINGDLKIEADGERGNVARFAGGGSFIDMDGPNWPADEQPIDGMSLLAWVNVESLANDHAIFNARAADDTWLIHPEVRSGGNFRWLLRSAGGNTIFDIKAGVSKDSQWMHFAGVYDSGNGAVLYIDGEEVMAADGGGTLVDSAAEAEAADVRQQEFFAVAQSKRGKEVQIEELAARREKEKQALTFALTLALALTLTLTRCAGRISPPTLTRSLRPSSPTRGSRGGKRHDDS